MLIESAAAAWGFVTAIGRTLVRCSAVTARPGRTVGRLGKACTCSCRRERPFAPRKLRIRERRCIGRSARMWLAVDHPASRRSAGAAAQTRCHVFPANFSPTGLFDGKGPELTGLCKYSYGEHVQTLKS